jgi:uncharacterized cupredoxin-like copper-binding protein
MKLSRRNMLLAASVFVATLSAGPAFAEARVVKVSLWDKGATSMNMLGQREFKGMGMGMGMGARPKGMPMAPMGIDVSVQAVSAGQVTFAVTNASTQMVHEMVISPVKKGRAELPYDKAENKVIEDDAGHLGEVAELEPGQNGALTVNLKPGQYILYCNIAGHYALGMWTLFTVTP